MRLLAIYRTQIIRNLPDTSPIAEDYVKQPSVSKFYSFSASASLSLTVLQAHGTWIFRHGCHILGSGIIGCGFPDLVAAPIE